MKYKVFDREIVVILETGDNIHQAVSEICKIEKIGMGTVTGFGGVQSLKFGIWNNDTNQYDYMERKDCNMELLNLTGNVSWLNGEPNIHIHVTAADNHGQVFGGHLVNGVVQNLIELYIYPGSGHIDRKPYKSWYFMDI